MKKFVRAFSLYALVPLLLAGFCVGYVWRDSRQHENDKALLAAVKASDTPAALAALKNGANPNARDIPDDSRTLKERLFDLFHPNRQRSSKFGFRIEEYRTALFLSVLLEFNNTAVIKALLDYGADPNAKILYPDSSSDSAGNPLVFAEMQRNGYVAHLLVEHHADIHVLSQDDQSPLMIAAGNNNCAEVEWLLQHGANIEEENSGGQRALSYAIDYDADTTAQYLVEHGADVNHKDKEGYTALYYARKSHNPIFRKLLIKARAVE